MQELNKGRNVNKMKSSVEQKKKNKIKHKIKPKKEMQIFRKTLSLLFKKCTFLILCQMIFAIVMFLVIAPVFSFIFEVAIKSSAFSYLKLENVIPFLVKPLTLLCIFSILIIGAVVLLSNMSLLLTFFSYVHQDKKMNLFWIYVLSAKRALIAIRPKNIGIIVAVWAMMLLSNTTVFVGIFTRIRIPNYAARTFGQLKEVKIFLILIIFLLLIYLVRYLFSIPYCILEGSSLKKALKQSRFLKKGKTLRTIGYFILWNLGVACIIAIIYFAMVAIIAVLVAIIVVPSRAVSVFLLIYDKINFYVGGFSAIFGMVANMALLSTLFCEYRELDGEIEPVLRQTFTKLPSNKRIAVVIVSVLVVLDVYWLYDISHNGPTTALENFEYTQITSHRGSSYYAPENTIPAVERAIEDGSNYAEIDVQMTKDGVVVLNHDLNLIRTIGLNKYIYNLNFEDLRKLDGGSWFSKEFAGTKIPTLEEVLLISKGKIKLNIELKLNQCSDDLEEKVVALIEQYHFERQCVITSSSQAALINVKELNSDIRTGKIMSFSFLQNRDQEGVDFFSVRSIFVTEPMVNAAHKRGKEIHVWTVDDKKELNRMKQLGVDNIITDNPLLAREVLYEEESSKPFLAILKIALR